MPSSNRLRRSVLYVPTSNRKALATLDCDAAIIDLEDSVMPEMKEKAREVMRDFLRRIDRGQKEIVSGRRIRAGVRSR